MNRQQRRRQARNGKKPGQNYAGVLAQKEIGKQTLMMAMEDEAVKLAADIICQQQLWAVVVALNEKFEFGPKRTRDLLEAMDGVLTEFEEMKKEHGYEYAEEKLRVRTAKVSGINVRYQHEAEKEVMLKMKHTPEIWQTKEGGAK